MQKRNCRSKVIGHPRQVGSRGRFLVVDPAVEQVRCLAGRSIDPSGEPTCVKYSAIRARIPVCCVPFLDVSTKPLSWLVVFGLGRVFSKETTRSPMYESLSLPFSFWVNDWTNEQVVATGAVLCTRNKYQPFSLCNFFRMHYDSWPMGAVCAVRFLDRIEPSGRTSKWTGCRDRCSVMHKKYQILNINKYQRAVQSV